MEHSQKNRNDVGRGTYTGSYRNSDKIFPGPDFNLKNTDYTMLTRIQEKIWKVLYGGNSTMLSDREWTGWHCILDIYC